MKKLTQQEALHLLSLIVDNEANENEREAFFCYIQTDDEILKIYENQLFIKQLLKTKYIPKKAPEPLKKKVYSMVEDMAWEQEELSIVDNTSSSISNKTAQLSEYKNDQQTPVERVNKPARYIMAAAVILLFSLLTIELLEKASSNSFQDSYEIEHLALSHFNSGNLTSASLASYQPESADHASQILQEEMSYQLKVPTIGGANLTRVMNTTFADGYTTPVLEFHQAGTDEIVHVFVFRIADLEKAYKMKRDPEAVKLCKTYNDYHVKDIEGKHVVSWKWEDYWYIAVSNHNGDELIALLEPIESDWDYENEEPDLE